ncbi:MFS substrate transporter [Salix suchowensis]|nr:MFS substrate transporter [Salix suchowensis]
MKSASLSGSSTPHPSSEKHSLDKDSVSEHERAASIEQVQPRPATYISQLSLWHGTFTDVNILKIFLRPFPFLLSPIVSCRFARRPYLPSSMGSTPLKLYVPLVCAPRLFLTVKFKGLTNLGGIVGIVLALLVTGPLTDWGTVWLSKRNKGIYEPEFRIFFISTMLFGVFGYAGWAVGTTHNMPWMEQVVNFSMVVSGAAAVTYLLDTHGHEALHVLALTNFSKNIVLYGFTFFANGMIERRGVKASLLILAGCQAFCWVVSIPMYLYGKRARSFVVVASLHPLDNERLYFVLANGAVDTLFELGRPCPVSQRAPYSNVSSHLQS